LAERASRIVCSPRRPFDFASTTILESIDGCSPTFERFELFERLKRSEQVKGDDHAGTPRPRSFLRFRLTLVLPRHRACRETEKKLRLGD
jgi:hypothetical protein